MADLGSRRSVGEARIEDGAGLRAVKGFIGTVHMGETGSILGTMNGSQPDVAGSGNWSVQGSASATGSVVTADSGAGHMKINSGASDGFVSMYKTRNAGAGMTMRVWFRCASNTSGTDVPTSGWAYRFQLDALGVQSHQLYRDGTIVFNSSSNLMPFVSAVANSAFMVEILLKGDTITVFGNGSQITTFTSTVHQTDTYVGSGWTGTGTIFDEMFVTSVPSAPGSGCLGTNGDLPLAPVAGGQNIPLHWRWARIGAPGAQAQNAGSVQLVHHDFVSAGVNTISGVVNPTVTTADTGYQAITSFAATSNGSTAGGSPRSGAAKIRVTMSSNGGVAPWTIDTENISTSVQGMTHDYHRLYFVASTAVSSVSDPLDDRAYPDSVTGSITLSHTPWKSLSHTMTFSQLVAAAEVQRHSSGTSLSSATYSMSTADVIDSAYTSSLAGVRMAFQSSNSGLLEPYHVFTAAPSGYEVAGTSGEIVRSQGYAAFTADPRIYVAQSSGPAPTTVYNRRETISGQVTVTNARNEGVTPRSSVTISMIDVTGDTAESPTPTVSHLGSGVYSYSQQTAASGNNAPATTTGAQKALRWRDSVAGASTPSDLPIGFLSRLLDLTDLTVPAGETVDSVYNRGETVTGSSFKILNRRGQPFVDFTGTESVVSERVADGADEELASIVSHDTMTGIITFSHTFGTSGNNAPATTAGDAKRYRWNDSATGNDALESPRYGYLSSLYDIHRFLQLNDNVLDPAKNVTSRLNADLGFYSVKITNRHGNPVNGAQGVLKLQDDRNLVTEITTATLTTAAQNGHNGYVPLQPWASSLPGGGWDLWASTQFTKDGNTTADVRKGTNSYDFQVLAPNPNYMLVTNGGMGDQGEGDHFQPGRGLLIGLSLVDMSTSTPLPVQDDPAPTIILGRFNASGRMEYLDPANLVDWVSIPEMGSAEAITLIRADLFSLGGGIPLLPDADPRVWIYLIPGNLTALWVEPTEDLFVLGTALYQGTPYNNYMVTPVLGNANSHSNYVFDGAGFLGFPSK